MKKKWIRLLALCLLGICGCSGGSGRREAEYGIPVESTIVPRVKSQRSTGEVLRIGNTVRYYSDHTEGDAAIRSLQIFLPEIHWEAAERENALLILQRQEDLSEHQEYYDMQIRPDTISVLYRDRLGARNAASTLAQMICPADGGYALSCGQVQDYPDSLFRSALLESSGRVWQSKEEVKEALIRMALAKLNYVHFHVMEYLGSTLPFDAYPNFPGYGSKNVKYTKDELRELIQFAEDLGIEMIPGVEMPAHSEAILKVMKEMRCTPGDRSPISSWVVCAGSEETYQVYRTILTEVAELFPGKYIHIGGDELDFGEGSGWEPSWMSCTRCQALSSRENLHSERDIYYYTIRRIHDIVSGTGKKMIMFNDQIDISVSPDLPRDIIIQFWRIATPGRGPYEGCTMERFLEEGFSLINSYYPEMYVDFEEYATVDSIRVWTPYQGPNGQVEITGQILGGEFCAWEKHDHYTYTYPSATLLYGDRLWNVTATCEYDDSYGARMTRAILGASTPDQFNVFAYLGSVFPPRDDQNKAYVEQISVSPEECGQALAILRELASREGYGAAAAAAYAECVEWVLRQ